MNEDPAIAPEAEVEPALAEDSGGLTSLIRRHPGYAIAGGLVLGLAAAALIPSRTRRKLARRTVAAATAATEAGLMLRKQGAAKLEELGETIGDGAGEARRRAAVAAEQARDTGMDWAKAALNLLAALRR